MALSTFYASESGYISRVPGSSETWSTIRGHTDGTDYGSTLQCQIGADSGTTDYWISIFRALVHFDSSAIPDTDNITSAVLDFDLGTCTNLRNSSNARPVSSPSALSTANYDQFGASAKGDTFTIPDGGYGTHKEVDLLTSAVSKTGTSQLGFRIGYDASNIDNWYSDQVIHLVVQSGIALKVWHYPANQEITPSIFGTGGLLSPTLVYDITPDILAGAGGILAPTVYKEYLVPEAMGGEGGILVPAVITTKVNPDLFGDSGGLFTIASVEDIGIVRAGCYVLPDAVFATEKSDNLSLPYQFKNPGNDPLDLTPADTITAKIYSTAMVLQTSVSCSVTDALDGGIAFTLPASTLGAGTFIVFFQIDWGGSKYSVLPETGQLSRITIRESNL